jgi:tetratricopeptide (TPR) repeat protein
MAKGLYEKSREVLESYLQNFKDNFLIHVGLSIIYFVQGKYDLSLAEADKMSLLNPSHFTNYIARGDIYRDMGNFLEAEKEYQKLFNLDEKAAHLYGRWMLAALFLMRGKYTEAESQANQGAELAGKIGDKGWEMTFLLSLGYIYNRTGKPSRAVEACNKAWGLALDTESSTGKRYSLLYKGTACLALNLPDDAQKTAADLKVIIDSGLNKKAIRYYYHLLGMIELQKKSYSSAIEYFEKAVSLLPYQHALEDDHAIFLEALASAYSKSGNVDQARQQYEKISRLTSGRFAYGDIYARSFYILGNIADQQGDKVTARENYEKFLGLWKDADPGIPEVGETRKNLAGLNKS